MAKVAAAKNKAKDVEKKTAPEAVEGKPKVNTVQLWAQLGRLSVQKEQAVLMAEKARQDMAAIYQQIAKIESERPK